VLEHTNAGDRWIPGTEYQFICSRVPIVCVDLLPLIGQTGKFGLIERDTYNGGRGLNLVGGAVLLDESLPDALERHVRATLGESVSLDSDSLDLVGVYQYYKQAKPGQLHDPRKNAVSVTYIGIIWGEAQPSGEAHTFQTFELDAPPTLDTFGFGQGPVVYGALARLTTT
jgi:ADP-ribose pyrophosphatase YjhB (NUDIX family)